MGNICKLCEILKSIPQDIEEYADRLYSLLDEDERADRELIESRLAVCNVCEKNAAGTCLACGCYCLIRSFARSQQCPKKRWN
jgi:hypothetical protein